MTVTVVFPAGMTSAPPTTQSSVVRTALPPRRSRTLPATSKSGARFCPAGTTLPFGCRSGTSKVNAKPGTLRFGPATRIWAPSRMSPMGWSAAAPPVSLTPMPAPLRSRASTWKKTSDPAAGVPTATRDGSRGPISSTSGPSASSTPSPATGAGAGVSACPASCAFRSTLTVTSSRPTRPSASRTSAVIVTRFTPSGNDSRKCQPAQRVTPSPGVSSVPSTLNRLARSVCAGMIAPSGVIRSASSVRRKPGKFGFGCPSSAVLRTLTLSFAGTVGPLVTVSTVMANADPPVSTPAPTRPVPRATVAPAVGDVMRTVGAPRSARLRLSAGAPGVGAVGGTAVSWQATRAATVAVAAAVAIREAVTRMGGPLV